jgi:hypothetical protein
VPIALRAGLVRLASSRAQIVGALLVLGAASLTWSAGAVAAHQGVKALFDPKGLLNPGKKLVRS